MKDFLKRTWAQIDLDAIEYNFLNIKEKLSDKTKLMCVLKADAYGHGVKFLVKKLEKLGVDWYGVSNIEEAIQLRNCDASKPILIFGYTPPELVPYLYNFHLSQAVFSYSYAMKLMEVCKEKKIKIKVHLKIDTGMSRIGFLAQNDEDIEKSLEQISELAVATKEFYIAGIFTHFSVADDMEHEENYTRGQFNRFMRLIDKLESIGVKIPIKHCCNSGATVNFPEMHLDMVRPGGILYGLEPTEEVVSKINLRPAMQLKTVISQVKKIKKGTSVSYGRTFVANRDMVIASVPIGYADGYFRNFSNKSSMLVCGERVSVIGKVCMDQCLLDVTSVPGVTDGCVVTVFGTDGDEKISANELAQIDNTIDYEITCLVGKRVTLVYYENGEFIGKFSSI